MNVLVIGSGGREHALVWALRKSPMVRQVFCAPGNAGMAGLCQCADILPKDVKKILAFVVKESVDLVVIGPEVPLTEGLADHLRAAGHKVFGPGAAGARLEGSKVFAKEFMKRHGIPTADYKTFSAAEDAMAFVRSEEWTEGFRVVKADGLAAGKGVLVCKDRAGVHSAIRLVMEERSFGEAGDTILLEEVLVGEEISVMALTDGETLIPLVTTQDHKRVFDNDQGPNTGGMGAYGPVPLTKETLARIDTEILGRFLAGVKADGLDYRGVIYAGIMLTSQGPRVLEFNVRFGDPETQVMMPLVSTDWAKLLLATAEGRLKGTSVRLRKGAALTVVMASGGYPGGFEKDLEITGIDFLSKDKDVLVFHAGTVREGSEPFKTAGGRVLSVTGLGSDLMSAREKAYDSVRKIHFDGAHFRTDIGAKPVGVSVGGIG